MLIKLLAPPVVLKLLGMQSAQVMKKGLELFPRFVSTIWLPEKVLKKPGLLLAVEIIK